MKKFIAGLLVITIVFLAFHTFLCCAWVGAEYFLEGDVHFSEVDKFVAFAISAVIVDNIFDLSKRKKR